jgi:hypothetical protein
MDQADEFDEFDDERQPAEEQPVVPGPARVRLPDDPEVPEADALAQAEEVVPASRPGRPAPGLEVPEADALDQSIEVPFDDEVDEPA